jgi:hypothetical protein
MMASSPIFVVILYVVEFIFGLRDMTPSVKVIRLSMAQIIPLAILETVCRKMGCCGRTYVLLAFNSTPPTGQGNGVGLICDPNYRRAFAGLSRGFEEQVPFFGTGLEALYGLG